LERLTWLVEGISSGAPALLAGGVVLVYGVVAARLLGARSRLLALGAATPVGIALVAISAQVLGGLGIIAPLGAYAVMGLGLAFGAGRLRLHRTEGEHHAIAGPDRIVWIGVAIGSLVTLGVWVGGIGNHALPPQANDDIWHGYLIERLTQMPFVTADTVAPTLADAPQPIVFYQYGLHLLWATVHAVSGISVAEVMNGGWIVQGALLLPLGAGALAWRLFPDRPWVALWGAALAPGVVLLPYLTNGLLPYTASLAMIPGFLAAFLTYVRGELRLGPMVPALAAAGIFLAHPSGAVVAAILATVITIEALVELRRWDALLHGARRMLIASLIAGVLAVPWLVAAGGRGLGDLGGGAAVPDVGSALWLVATLGTPWTSAQPALGVAVLAGAAAALIARRGLGLTAAWAIFAALFVGTAIGDPWFTGMTQAWHGQWYRIVAVLGILVPVMAGLGIATVAGWIRARAPLASAARLGAAAVGAIALVMTIGAAYGAAQGQGIVRASWHASGLLTSTDVAVFRQLADLTGPGDRVFNSPRDGSSWMYAMYGVIPTQPYIYQTPRRSWDLVNDLSVYRNRSVVCSRLARDGVTHAIVKQVTGDIPGLEAYDVAGFIERYPDLFDEIARSPTAVAYQVDQQALNECLGP
jgi:hypothetical protein